jgi:hypothetical protein
MSEAVAPSAPTDATMLVATSGKRYSETVSSFHIFELPESSRKSSLAPLFQQDISFPMSGPFFIKGDTADDANQLMLRMTRAATAFTLLIDVDCTGPAATAMERLLLKRQQILSAVQGIDGANGRSVKAGASPTIFSSLTVDSDGRPAASGTNLASFHLKLQTLNFPSAPLWQESLEVLRKSNLLLVTDDVTRKGAWPTYGGTSILVISEVVRAALDYRKVAHSEVVLARMPLNLLALTLVLQGDSTFIRRAHERVEASRRAVSGYLLDTGSHQEELARAVTQSFSLRLDDVAQL